MIFYNTYNEVKSDTGFVVQHMGSHQFARFKSIQTFKKFLDKQEQKCFAETIPGDRPQKIKFDLDMKDATLKQAQECVLKVMDAVIDLLDVKYQDFIVSCSNGTEKKSYHIVLNRYVDTYAESHYVYWRVNNELDDPHWLDKMAYSKLQQWRIEGCRKPNSDRIKLLIRKIKGKKLYNAAWEDTLITNTDCKRLDLAEDMIIHKYPSVHRIKQIAHVDPDKWENVLSHLNVTSKKKKTRGKATGTMPDTKLKRIFRMLGNELDHHSVRTATSDCVTFYRTESSYCDLCERTHDNDNTLYVRISPKYNVFRHCFRAKGSNNKYIGHFGDPRTLKKLKESEKRRKWKEAVTRPYKPPKLSFPNTVTQKIYSAKYIEDLERCRTLFVRGAMGLGKTEALKRYLTQHKPKRVISLSFRVTLTEASASRLDGFTKYSDIQGEIDAEKLLVQLESLYRVKFQETDLLIIDECESILQQWESRTFKNFNGSWGMFLALVRDCPHVICMDALLGNRTVDFMHRVRGMEDATYHYNKRKNKKDYNMHITNKENAWKLKLEQAVGRGKTVVVPTNGIKKAKEITERLKQLYPDKNIALYSSETDAKVKKKAFANVNKVFAKLDVLIYTPTMSAGVSFDVEHFDCLFAYFSDQSCPYDACVQMLGRVRSLNDKELFVCLSTSCGAWKSESVDELDLQYDRDRYGLLKHFAPSRFQYRYGKWSKDLQKNDYYYLFLANKAHVNQSSNRFRQMFVNAVKSSGMKCCVMECGCDDGEIADVRDGYRDIKCELDDAACEAVANAKKITKDEAEALRYKGEELTLKEKSRLRKYTLKERYGRKVTAELVKTYDNRKVKQQYDNLKAVSRYKSIGKALKDITAMEAKNMVWLNQERDGKLRDERLDLHQKKTSEHHKIAHSFIEACGFDHLHDEETVTREEILESLQDHEKTFKNLRVVNRLFDKRKKEVDLTNLKKTLDYINGVLRSIYGIHIGTRTKSWKDRSTYIIHKNDLFNGKKKPKYDISF